MTETHMTKDETATFVIEGQKVTVTAQQLLGLKQDETTDPDEKYAILMNELEPSFYLAGDGKIMKTETTIDFENVPSQLSAQRVRTYIKLLNIAAKLNGEADWNGEGYFLSAFEGIILIARVDKEYKALIVKFKTRALALEALTYLNSEDKIAMFGCDKVKQD